MRRHGKVHCSRDILSSFLFFPLDFYCKRYCTFQEDAIMTQQHSPRIKPVVTVAAICFILTTICCYLPQVDSLGSECYTITGRDYRGRQDSIGLPPEAGERLTKCLTWNTSSESKKPRAREKGIGNHSYCRNPDNDILPWCKVKGRQGSEGAWGYCHLPECEVPGYLGCFPDRGSPSALNGEVILHKYMTVGSCIAFCRRNNFKYAGLEAGHACYCGNQGYDRYGKAAYRGTHCHDKCFGIKTQPCGGDGYMDVYKAELGTCGTEKPLRSAAGAIYSPGYPDFPGSSDMMTTMEATESMLRKQKDRLHADDDPVSDKTPTEFAKKPKVSCAWDVHIGHATKINTIVRKIDTRRKLGGIIEIEAGEGSSLSLTTPDGSVVTSHIMWIVNSSKARNELEAIVPPAGALNQSATVSGHSRHASKWSHTYGAVQWPRYPLPPRSIDPVLSVLGHRFSTRFIRSQDLIGALKNAYAFAKQRSRRRRKSAEWSRFVIEYEAVFPEGYVYQAETLYTEQSEAERSDASQNEREQEDKKAESERADVLQNARITISREDALAIQRAVSGEAGVARADGGSPPLKIDVYVESVESEKAENDKDTTTQSLLFVVIATTTAILILFAVLLLYRRRFFHKKPGKPGKGHDYTRALVVSCPRDCDTEKSASNSNLSSSSTADSVLLTDSESRYSPRGARKADEARETTLDDVIKFLKSQPGLIQSHPAVDIDHKQPPGHHHHGMTPDSRHDDLAPLPGPCAHCCGCPDENRAHRHGDSCRAHQTRGPGRPKNPRGLSIRPTKQAQLPSLAPPLSPISEVSSVSSANSQTSLLKQKASHKQSKRDEAKFSELATSQSDSEPASGRIRGQELQKPSFLDRKGGKTLGHPLVACYDSGYATSNYEDDENASIMNSEVPVRLNTNEIADS